MRKTFIFLTKNDEVPSHRDTHDMNHETTDESALGDWESIGLQLLTFTLYWARTHYRWSSGKPLPNGQTPEDLVCDVYSAYVTGQRKINPSVDILVQLKGAIRSVLWNLYTSKEARTTAPTDPEKLVAFMADGNPADEVGDDDYCATFWQRLYEDNQVKRSADLTKFARAIEAGAETIPELTTATGFTVAQAYELRRRLKAVAERVLAALNTEGATHETAKQ
ncbi:hypothetical protein MASR2M8_10690 [Opitutaceae bacterium]